MHIFLSSNMGFRDKGYFSVNDYYSLNERVVSSCSYMGVFSTRGIAMSPRFLYGSRQSTLIRWSVCRSPFLGGSGYCQLAAPRCCCSCDCDRSCQASRPLGQRQRERRVACVGWEQDGFNSSGDESVHEMLSLLASSNDKKSSFKDRTKTKIRRQDVDEKQKNNSSNDKKSSFKDRTKTKIRRQDVDEKEKNKRVDQRWKKEEKLVGSGSSGRSSKSETLVKSWEGYRLSRKENSLKDDISDMRKDGSASSYYSASSGADLDNSLDLISTADQRFYTENESTMDMNLEDKVKAKHRKVGESSSSLKTDSRRESGKHLQKYEDERISSARREGKDKSDVMESHVEWGSSKYSDTTSAISESRGNGTLRTSNAEKLSTIRVENKEEDSTSFVNLVQGAREQSIQKGKQFVGHNDSKREARRLSRIREGGAEIASSSEMAFNASVKDKETTNSAVNMIKEVREQNIQTDELTERIESQRKIQKLTNISVVQSSDIEKASSYENLSKTRVDDKEEIWEAREQPAASNGRVIGQTESRIGFQRPSSTAETHVIGTEISNSSQKVSKTTVSSREDNSGSYTNMIQEDREKQQQTSERLTRENVSTKESQRLTKIVEFHESDLGRASSSLKRAIKGMKNNEESSSSQLSLSTKLREGQMVLPRAEERESHSQSVASGSTNDRNPSSYKTPEAFRETLGHRSGRERDEIYEEHAEPIVNDALSSANRLEESSKQFVEEFVDKVQEEISTSQKFTISSKEEKYLQKDENISLDFRISLDDPRRSSSVGPAPKGPSDEMWAEAGQSSQEPYKTKHQKNESSTVGAVASPSLTDAGSSIVRRSGRSLWAYIGDIVRRGWGSHSVTHTSTPKPSARFSPNESVSSESWFSGNDPDVDDGENVKKGRRGTQKSQPIGKFRDKPQASKTSIQSQEVSETTGVEEKVAQVKADISTSIDTVEIKGSLASGKNALLRIEGAMETTTVGPTLTTVDTSLALLGTLPFSSLPLVDGATPPLMGSSLRPPSPLTTFTRKEEISEIGEVQVNRSDAMEVRVAPVQEKHAGGTEGKEMELKRRKLQRNKQVLKERFDEWEEAFTLEQDQRKVDEMYMREALDEAKKAADTWEVPVGAVLVQHGKIIARGCNLVEELRDSTAHAEMICIREASNVLRTWRLAETTLYVTLEPCPMCAGAILQARIDTVVWGAPNKLLGADGSWVSLFPTGNDGTSSEQPNRPAGPVHPFHPKMTIRRGVLATECAEVMQQFFHMRRKKIRKQEDSTGDPSCLPVSNPSKFLSKIHDLFGMMFCL